MIAIYILLSFVALFFSHQRMIHEISKMVHRLGGGHNTTIWIWSIIFLPGTIIHEISHFLAASFTGARTGKIEIFPEYLDEENDLSADKKSVALGYVQTQHLNPIQGFLVGMAPFFSGIALLVFLSSRFQSNYLSGNYPLFFLEGYFFFVIANSFFPSWSDIKQTITFVFLSATVIIIAWFFGAQIFISLPSQAIEMANSLWMAITISVIINIFFSLSLHSINTLIRH